MLLKQNEEMARNRAGLKNQSWVMRERVRESEPSLTDKEHVLRGSEVGCQMEALLDR